MPREEVVASGAEEIAPVSGAQLDEMVEQYAPPLIVESRCAVCKPPFNQYRVWIERQVVLGRSYQSIAAGIPPDPETGRRLDRRSISGHYRLHMNVEQAAARGLLEEEASLIRQNVDEGVRGAITNRGVLQVLVQKAYQSVQDGQTVVEPRDLIQMIKLLRDLETNTSSAEAEEAKMAIQLFSQAIKNVSARRRDDALLVEIRDEVQRLRQMDDIEATVEENLGPPSLGPGQEVVEADADVVE